MPSYRVVSGKLWKASTVEQSMIGANGETVIVRQNGELTPLAIGTVVHDLSPADVEAFGECIEEVPDEPDGDEPDEDDETEMPAAPSVASKPETRQARWQRLQREKRQQERKLNYG